MGASVLAWIGIDRSAAHDGPHTHQIIIEKFKFVPASLTIKPGDTVEWINKDLAPHTATAKDKTMSTTWDTGSLSKDAHASTVFQSAGSFAYFCRFHPHMTGEIIVSEEGAAPAP